jgi:hypothetical protein
MSFARRMDRKRVSVCGIRMPRISGDPVRFEIIGVMSRSDFMGRVSGLRYKRSGRSNYIVQLPWDYDSSSLLRDD